MPRKNGKLPADHSGRQMAYRSATIERERASDDARSIPMVLATDAPIEVYSQERMDVIREKIELGGMEFGAQVPLIDSHERETVRNVIGSIRDLQVRDGKLIGRAYFASDQASRDIYEKYRDGHLTDFSVGASVIDGYYNEDGDRIVTRSRLTEGSAVVAGQDPNAKVMASAIRAYVDPYSMKEEAMDKAIRNLLIERGLDENATDAEALEFLETSLTSTVAPEGTTVVTSDEITATDDDETSDDTPTDEPSETTETTTIDAVTAERKRIAAIGDLCRKHNVPDSIQRKLIDDGASVDRAAREILDGKKPGKKLPTMTPGLSEREKWYSAVHAGVIARTGDSISHNPKTFLANVERVERGDFGRPAKYQDSAAVRRNQQLLKDMESPIAGADDFRYATLPDIARQFLERSGERVHNLPKVEICRRAMAMPNFIQRSDQATNTTGSFSNLLLDAANKTLLAGYDEAEHSYTMWVRQAPSAADFKTLNRIRFGELADPEVVPENHQYPEKGTQDSKESYGVEKYGEIFSISLEAVVNDDLNAITRIPQMQGFAMRRKINKVVYSVLTANAALSDGIALFHASSHGANLDSNALAESALDTGFTVMSQQTGLSGTGTPLGLRPSYLIVPSALAPTAWRLVTGGVVPVASGSTVPLYGDGRPRALMVIEEPQLDANSTTAWYLAANSGAVETVEITFLQGEESPVLSREEGFSTDTLKYKIRQTFASKAIDYRGLYQGNA